MPKPTEVPGLSATTPLSVAAPLIVRARLSDVRQYERALAGDGEDREPDADAVHDMRVAARRLRASLAVLGDRDLAAMEDEVKALQDALGAVRDHQVQRAWLEDAASSIDANGARRLAAWSSNGFEGDVRALRLALRGWSTSVAPTLFERSPAVGSGDGTLGGPRIAKAVRGLLRTVEGRIGRVLADPAPRPAHRLRIAVKKLRYTTELARSGRKRAAKALLARLEPLQERLGELHDTDVREALLARAARSGDAVQRRTADRLLRDVRAGRARQARALVEELGRWRDDELGDLFLDAFRKRRVKRRIRPALARVADAAHA